MLKYVRYNGKRIGKEITTFKDLFAIKDDPNATERQKEAAMDEVRLAMDDFS